MSSIIIATWQDIAKVLATKRVYDGNSQADIAALMHLSPKTVGAYENGLRTPPADTLILWSRVSGYDLGIFRRTPGQPA